MEAAAGITGPITEVTIRGTLMDIRTATATHIPITGTGINRLRLSRLWVWLLRRRPGRLRRSRPTRRRIWIRLVVSDRRLHHPI